MSDDSKHRHGVHRYRNVTDGVAMANEYLSSRLSVSEFARQKGVSFKMVTYWCARARQLAAAASASAPPTRPGHLIPIGTIDEHHAIIVGQPPAEDQARSSPPPAAPPPPPSPIEVHLPSGVRVSVGPGFSPELLRSVIACLGQPC
ncbi:MAG: hypothetical protein J0M02_00720 [Planctomycetes bacterium]|nr:hypothetical protein [Planctomycetota bacterium]